MYLVAVEPKDYATIALAIIVPYLTYRFANRQDSRAWRREKRAEIYVELIAEVERRSTKAMELLSSDDATASPPGSGELAARLSAFGSGSVTAAHDHFVTEIGQTLIGRFVHPRDVMLGMSLQSAAAGVRAAVRKELAPNTIRDRWRDLEWRWSARGARRTQAEMTRLQGDRKQ